MAGHRNTIQVLLDVCARLPLPAAPCIGLPAPTNQASIKQVTDHPIGTISTSASFAYCRYDSLEIGSHKRAACIDIHAKVDRAITWSAAFRVLRCRYLCISPTCGKPLRRSRSIPFIVAHDGDTSLAQGVGFRWRQQLDLREIVDIREIPAHKRDTRRLHVRNGWAAHIIQAKRRHRASFLRVFMRFTNLTILMAKTLDILQDAKIYLLYGNDILQVFKRRVKTWQSVQ